LRHDDGELVADVDAERQRKLAAEDDLPAAVGEVADGVIIGTRLVRAAGEGATPAESADGVASFLAETRVSLAG